ncbi:MAG TPA: hypothetical protein VGJ54_16930 [Streptosporangiaceae bacterium]
MSHPALVNEVLFWLVVLLTLLLVMFLYAVITAHTEHAKPAEAPVPEPPVLTPPTRTPPAPVSPLPSRRPPAHTSPASATGRPGGTGYPARHTTAARAVIAPPKVSSGPRRSAVAPILGIGGVALAVIGGWMFLNVPHADLACSHQAAAICLQGSVLLTGTQLLGGAIALAGIALAVTALFLALRS